MTCAPGGIAAFGRELRSPSRLQTFGAAQSRAHCGCAHFGSAAHFQEHWGSAQRLSQSGLHFGWQRGGPQTVLHFGQFPWAHTPGQTTAQTGGSQAHAQPFAAPQIVSHCGGAHTGSQTWSQSLGVHCQLHFGWQSLNVLSPAAGPPAGAGAGAGAGAPERVRRRAAYFVGAPTREWFVQTLVCMRSFITFALLLRKPTCSECFVTSLITPCVVSFFTIIVLDA